MHCLCAAEYVAVWFSAVRISAQKLFLYVLVLYCVTLLAMAYIWTEVEPAWWRRWKCPDSTPPPLLCIFTTFKPNWKKLAVGNLTNSQRLGILWLDFDFTQRPKISIFASQGPFITSIHVKFGRGELVSTWPWKISRQWVQEGGYASSKDENFHFLVKIRLAEAYTSTEKLNLSGPFARPTTLRYRFTFDMIHKSMRSKNVCEYTLCLRMKKPRNVTLLKNFSKCHVTQATHTHFEVIFFHPQTKSIFARIFGARRFILSKVIEGLRIFNLSHVTWPILGVNLLFLASTCYTQHEQQKIRRFYL